MLLQMIVHQPQILVPVLKGTPTWVWGLLAGLACLGLSQARERTASRARTAVMPIAMTSLSLWGTVSAFGASPMFGYVMLAWMFAAAVMLAVVTPTSAPSGSSYDAATRTFRLPGSWVPLALILAIFLVKYVVGVDLAMQPTLSRDGEYTLVVGALYGLSSGVFAGRAARLWRLAFQPAEAAQPALNA